MTRRGAPAFFGLNRMLLTYTSLTLAILALWSSGDERAPAARRFIWVALLASALVAALATGIVRPLGAVWIAGLAAACVLFERAGSPRWARAVAAVAILVLTLGLMAHRLPGFNNPLAIASVKFSTDALPFRLHLNFDKTTVGLLLLGLCHPRLTHAADWRAMFATAAPIAAGTIAVVMVLSLAMGYVRFEPKFPAETWLWLWVNLCFTCLAEEALFRGFIQAQLQRLWQRVPRGEWLALAVAAVLFGVAHAAGGLAYVALATVAGLGYGWAYRRTGRIEASILTHFALNTVHFFGFTYPALQRAS